ncbi:AAA family ATPase [Deinococcus deserti]|uniref:Putative kinase n=1 Tax=Deinococcus deserti (strain DSM 17065 / CIP 109153 / LMG 22923 / VCD115) TaxID=546414 RepID=C1CZP2_DEIDV|nr:AAA family ATPase [Deinococcus deserti]ACO47290.1 putative kinase [Deinococcus deserti VCD115]
MLVVFSGLPGTGKSSLARLLAPHLHGAYIRIDSVEAAILETTAQTPGVTGYAAAYAIAADNVGLGLNVVADCVNPLAVTRQAWMDVADRAGVPLVNIEVLCSDQDEHRRRVTGRADEAALYRGHVSPAWAPPTWESVQASRQAFEPWAERRLVIDTAGQTVPEAFATLLADLHLSYGVPA